MERLEIRDLLHITLGSLICFLVTFLILMFGIFWSVISSILIRLNCVGLLAFNEVNDYAIPLLQFVIAYLPSGFCGGLYTGSKIKENLRMVLTLLPLIALAILTASIFIQFQITYGMIPSVNVQSILLPLIGYVIGSYLGGYSMNWEIEEGESSGLIEVDASQVRS